MLRGMNKPLIRIKCRRILSCNGYFYTANINESNQIHAKNYTLIFLSSALFKLRCFFAAYGEQNSHL